MQKQAFVGMQFDAQDRHYRQHYPRATFDVIVVDGQPCGRLYVNRSAEEIRIIDISLLPAFRGKGIGTLLLTGLLDEATAAGSTVSIHVERFNPAMRLYIRLGFSVVGDEGVYLLMERPAGTSAQPNTAS